MFAHRKEVADSTLLFLFGVRLLGSLLAPGKTVDVCQRTVPREAELFHSGEIQGGEQPLREDMDTRSVYVRNMHIQKY